MANIQSQLRIDGRLQGNSGLDVGVMNLGQKYIAGRKYAPVFTGGRNEINEPLSTGSKSEKSMPNSSRTMPNDFSFNAGKISAPAVLRLSMRFGELPVSELIFFSWYGLFVTLTYDAIITADGRIGFQVTDIEGSTKILTYEKITLEQTYVLGFTYSFTVQEKFPSKAPFMGIYFNGRKIPTYRVTDSTAGGIIPLSFAMRAAGPTETFGFNDTNDFNAAYSAAIDAIRAQIAEAKAEAKDNGGKEQPPAPAPVIPPAPVVDPAPAREAEQPAPQPDLDFNDWQKANEQNRDAIRKRDKAFEDFLRRGGSPREFNREYPRPISIDEMGGRREPAAVAVADPHLNGFKGQRFDFHGEPGKCFNLIFSKTTLINSDFGAWENLTIMETYGITVIDRHQIHKVMMNSKGELYHNDRKILDELTGYYEYISKDSFVLRVNDPDVVEHITHISSLALASHWMRTCSFKGVVTVESPEAIMHFYILVWHLDKSKPFLGLHIDPKITRFKARGVLGETGIYDDVSHICNNYKDYIVPNIWSNEFKRSNLIL